MKRGQALVATPEYAFDCATPETAELEKKLDKLEMHYTSSDPSILVVDDNGNLVAVGAGTAEVALSSKDGTVSTSKTLEVIVSPTEIRTADELTLTAGEVATLKIPDDCPTSYNDYIVTFHRNLLPKEVKVTEYGIDGSSKVML